MDFSVPLELSRSEPSFVWSSRRTAEVKSQKTRSRKTEHENTFPKMLCETITVFVSDPGESEMQKYRRVFISVTIIITTTTTTRDEGGDIDVRCMRIDTLPCWIACVIIAENENIS